MSALAEVTNSPRRIPISQKPQFILSPPSSSPTPTPTHDAFGFPIENNTVVVNGIQLSKQGEAAWKQYSSSSLCNFRTDALHSIVLKHGIPSHRRGDLWYQWSGAEEKCETSTLKYADYENKPCDKKIKQQIELDLPRTCPKHAAFLCENPEEEDPSKQIVGPGRTSIGKVLRAYAVRNPKLGYLQSMNFLAAMLYLVMDGNESKMFWTLTTIVEDILPGYFTAKLHKLLENVDAFSILLSQMYPKVAANLEKYGLNITFRAPTWFLCMYFTSLKSEVVARVWDAIFFNVKCCPDGAGGPAAAAASLQSSLGRADPRRWDARCKGATRCSGLGCLGAVPGGVREGLCWEENSARPSDAVKPKQNGPFKIGRKFLTHLYFYIFSLLSVAL